MIDRNRPADCRVSVVVVARGRQFWKIFKKSGEANNFN